MKSLQQVAAGCFLLDLNTKLKYKLSTLWLGLIHAF